MGSPTVIRDAPAAAVIGGGFIGPVHVEALRRIGVNVVGLLGSSPARAQPMADALAIPRVYADLDDLLGDDQVGAVHVASPNSCHFEQARRVLESGRHLVCEKPLATSSRETSALCGLAQARPAQAAAVNYNIRYYPLCREIRERIASGALGRVLSVTGSYVQDWLLYPDDYNWRVEPDGHTNLRAAADIGTHWMDLAQYLIATPIRAVSADLATFHPRRYKPTGPSDTFSGSNKLGDLFSVREVEITTDDHAAVLLKFDRGVRGAVPRLASHRRPQEPADDRNRGHRRLSFPGTANRPNRLWIGARKGPNQLLERDPALLGEPAASLCNYPADILRGSPIPSSSSFSTSTVGSHRGGDADSRFPFPPWRTEITKFVSVKRSLKAPPPSAWVTVEESSHQPSIDHRTPLPRGDKLP